jgi:hypothetical protein
MSCVLTWASTKGAYYMQLVQRDTSSPSRLQIRWPDVKTYSGLGKHMRKYSSRVQGKNLEMAHSAGVQ